jgi:outer membrane protein assembly factor BamB
MNSPLRVRIDTLLFLTCVTLVSLPPAISHADDWPQFQGPNRDGVYRESGIVNRFPANGPPVKWRVPVGWGYAGPAVVDGRVFLMDYQCVDGKSTNNPGSRDRLMGTERVTCFDAQNGTVLWQHAYKRPYFLSFASGPRCTPSVDGNRVYALGAEGNLWCLSTADGSVLWNKDFVNDYGAETAIWGVAAHPLVDDQRVYCVVGGEGSVAVAFDKQTGKELWRNLSADQPGYCPPTMIRHAGRKQLLIWHGESVNALAPATGKSIWSANVKPNFGMSIAPPTKLGADLLVASYGASALLRLNADGSDVETVWRGKPKTSVYCGTSPPMLEDGVAYGCDITTSALTAVRLSDGERLWQTLVPTLGKGQRGRYGTAFLIKHQDRFFLFNEKGDLIIARLSPQGYQEIDRCHLLEPTNKTFGRLVVWSPPAFAQKSLFVRNDKELVCVDLAAGSVGSTDD